jgi:hypothetical protein
MIYLDNIINRSVMNSQQYQIDKINKDQKDNYSILQKKIDDEKLERTLNFNHLQEDLDSTEKNLNAQILKIRNYL